jgi:hypothetical protein
MVLAAVLTGAPARAAQTEVFIEVNPNSIQPGLRIGIHASCGENVNTATVRSGAFSEITLTPRSDSLLAGEVTIPTTTKAGEYHVELRCANGDTATAELFVIDMARPTRGPATGGGGAAGLGAGAGSPGNGGAGAAWVLLGAGGIAALGAGAGRWWRRRLGT